MRTINVRNAKEVKAVFLSNLRRANHHAPDVSEAVDKLTGVIFSNGCQVDVGTRKGKITASLWAKINGEWKYLCYDYRQKKIAVKDKKGGTVLGHIDNRSTSVTIMEVLGITK
jgi:hypothetical protein